MILWLFSDLSILWIDFYFGCETGKSLWIFIIASLLLKPIIKLQIGMNLKTPYGFILNHVFFIILLVAQFQGSISVTSLFLLLSNAFFKHITNIKQMLLLILDSISDSIFYYVSHFKQNSRFM